MRTTIELPDNLLMRARSEAALAGVSLKEFFVSAIEQKLVTNRVKHRRPPPMVDGPSFGVLTDEQMEEAMSGPVPL